MDWFLIPYRFGQVIVPYIAYILAIFLLLDLLYMYRAKKNNFELKCYYFNIQKNIDFRISTLFKIISYLLILSAFFFIGSPESSPHLTLWFSAVYIYSVLTMVIKFYLVKSKAVI